MPTTPDAAAPGPVSSDIRGASRRREIGAGSARSLLLTVLGEFVHPRAERVWTATLVEALGALGVEEKAARQALTRTANEGLLTSSRHGRRVLWDLTDSGADLLEAGTKRIYGFMRRRRTWDGHWLVVTVSIPETQRQLRHRFRTRLTWLGLGSPTSGLWITPEKAKEPEVHAVIRDLGLDGQAFAWAGPATGIGDESRLIQEAWDLDEVEGRYLDFLTGFEERRAETPCEAFVAQVLMVQEWRRFPFLDPDLPSELLDHDWPGPRAAAVFHDRHARWHRQAQAEWDRMDEAGGEKP
ncbi:MAG TPA: PaaX family transcriptional regulator C-terminal domain-containing protein [Nocardioidaceae bacterium]|nr:PaaX family transcriptional regulator C-terminal domain-containing protein [Nocardioidaceae bacterium]